jgi:hypothetical protein
MCSTQCSCNTQLCDSVQSVATCNSTTPFAVASRHFAANELTIRSECSTFDTGHNSVADDDQCYSMILKCQDRGAQRVSVMCWRWAGKLGRTLQHCAA